MEEGYDYEGLEFEPTSEGIDEAIKMIDEERSGRQYGLYSRWNNLNRAFGKYFRFGEVTMIAGMSGSGKSYFLNMLRQDFLDNKHIEYKSIGAFNLNETPLSCYYDVSKGEVVHDIEEENAKYYPKARLLLHDGKLIHAGLNRNCEYDVVCIHFGFEMSQADELLRQAGNRLSKSYGYLLSSEYDSELGDYKKLTPEERDACVEVLNSFRQRKEYYIKSAGNTKQMYNTVYFIKNKFPNSKIVVTIDHTLLAKKLDEKSEAELQANTAVLCMDLKTNLDCMVLPLNQLNQGIEDDDRKTKPNLQFPKKSDIYHGGHIWWACDNVLVNHRPQVLNISAYGIDKLNTNHLMHSAKIKSRKGHLGNLWFQEDFANGRILEATRNDFMPK